MSHVVSCSFRYALLCAGLLMLLHAIGPGVSRADPILQEKTAVPGVRQGPQVPGSDYTRFQMTAEALCRNYAEEAVRQYHQAMSNHCGYTGGAWNGDLDRHYQWCMGADASQREQERQARRDALALCGEREKFDDPMYQGKRLDLCMYPGDKAHCGKSVADSYCIHQGFRASYHWWGQYGSEMPPSGTIHIGNGALCRSVDSGCRGFAYIICQR